jgi:hypothetical protein
MKQFLKYSVGLNVGFLLSLCFAMQCFAQYETKFEADDPTAKEARRLWELAIEAKGGRERLESVKIWFFPVNIRSIILCFVCKEITSRNM